MDSNNYYTEYEPFRRESTLKQGNHGAYEMITRVDDPPTNPIIAPESKEPASWTMEVVTLVASILFFAAQVGILIWVMDKPYHESWKVPLSINAVIAILTTACKASQLHSVSEAIGQVKWVDFKASPRRLKQFDLYDATSRGPQGAVEFILKVRWGLATVGAFIVISALAADPFTQQVIELKPQNVTTPDDTAIIGFAEGYDTKLGQTALNGVLNPEISSRDPGIQGAILRGIYNIQSPDEFQCAGACSWNETYRSLGFSSTCKDIKETAEATKACSTEGFTVFCNYTTPGNVSFSTEYVRTDSATALLVAVNDTILDILEYSSETKPRVPAEFLRAAVFQSNSGEDSSFNDAGIRAENITECALSLTLHEYSNITANGSQLNFVHESRKLEPGWRAFNASSMGNQNITFNQSEIGPIDPPFVVNGYDFASAIYFFESNVFTSHIISGNAIQGKDTIRVGTGAAFLNTDVPTVFTALAKSMTDYLRSLSKGPNVKTEHGARIDSVIFVRVRWEWLILPLAQELASIIFVIWVIVYNKRHRIPGWKSSALAALAHNLDRDSFLVTNFRGPKEIERYAKNVDAQIK
ncbi:hypothetical protein GGR58DRAFT_164082 [Xylaria digitata]|nr:hypothetical protein GGR58DRAFT_164082 [Xylaria digitata]